MGLPDHLVLQGGIQAHQVEGEWAGPRGYVGERLVQRVIGHDRQQRAEDLLLHQLAVVRHLGQQMGQQAVGAIVPGRAATGVYLGACPLGFGQPAGEPFILAAIDDGAVIRTGQPLGIEAGEVIAIGLDKGLLLTTRQQHIVGATQIWPALRLLPKIIRSTASASGMSGAMRQGSCRRAPG